MEGQDTHEKMIKGVCAFQSFRRINLMRLIRGIFLQLSARDYHTSNLGYNLAIHRDSLDKPCLLSCTLLSLNRQPVYWVLVEEWPWWNDGEERKCCAAKTYVESELDVLGNHADEEGNRLKAV